MQHAGTDGSEQERLDRPHQTGGKNRVIWLRYLTPRLTRPYSPEHLIVAETGDGEPPVGAGEAAAGRTNDGRRTFERSLAKLSRSSFVPTPELTF